MSQSMILDIAPDGTGHCLYSELIDLHALGRLECRRASHVEFNESSQQWDVLTPDRKTVLHSHPTRSACLEWEQANLLPQS